MKPTPDVVESHEQKSGAHEDSDILIAPLTSNLPGGGCMAGDQSNPPRASLSVRARFEIFKRDEFQCRYCGRRSPEVVLEIDHIVPVCEGGSNDEINLVTACWECNRGKAGIPLSQMMTAEDPHDKAILIIEKERQIREYNAVLAAARARREAEGQELVNYWCEHTGRDYMPKPDWTCMLRELEPTPAEMIREAMLVAISRDATNGLRYVSACLRNWKDEGRI